MPNPRRVLVAGLVLCLALPAAAAEPAPLDLDPPNGVTAPWPAAEGADTHPERISIVTGEAGSTEFAAARAYVHAPLAKVLDALRCADVVVDRRRVTEWKTTPDAAPRYGFGFLTDYLIRAMVTVEMPIAWWGGILQGTASAPEAVVLRSRKVGGTHFVSLLEDAIVARVVDANTTSLELVRRTRAFRYGRTEAAQYQQDLFGSILAHVRGRPLPKYD